MPATAETRGYTATKGQLVKRLKRIECRARRIQGMERTDETMAAVGRLLTRG